jgi:hypothetical protein
MERTEGQPTGRPAAGGMGRRLALAGIVLGGISILILAIIVLTWSSRSPTPGRRPGPSPSP